MLDSVGHRRLLILSWLAVSFLLTLLLVRDPHGLVGDLTYLAVAVAAAGMAWLGCTWQRRRERVAAVLIAAALTASAIGDVYSRYLGWQRGAEPVVSGADVAWAAFYVLFGLALLGLLRPNGPERRRDVDILIDVAAVTVAGALVVWELALDAVLHDDSAPLSVRLMWGLYPVLDLVVLVLAWRLFLRDRTVASLVLVPTLLVLLIADLAYVTVHNTSAYSVLLDAAWLWGVNGVALAVLVGLNRPLRRSGRRLLPSDPDTGLGRVLAAFLPLLVPVLLEVHWLLRGRDARSVIILVGAVVLVTLAFIRVARLARSARSARAALASQKRYASALAANSSDAVAVVGPDLRLLRDSRDWPRWPAGPAPTCGAPSCSTWSWPTTGTRPGRRCDAA